MKNGLLRKLIPHIIALFVFFIVSLFFSMPAFEGKVLEQDDIIGAEGMAKNAFDWREQHGRLALWNTNLFSGMPNYQVAIEGPSILLNWTKIITFGLPKPANFFFLACICFYILAMAFRVRPIIGIFGALAYAFATYNPIIIAAGHDTKMMAIAYGPAMLAGLVWIYERKYAVGLAVMAFFGTMEVAVNHPQINYYMMLIAAFMTLSYLVIWIRKREWKHAAMALSLALLAGLISIGNAAVTLFTTYDYAKYTMRGGKNIEKTDAGTVVTKKTQGLDPSYAFAWSLGKSESVILFMPNAFGRGSSQAFEPDSKLVKEMVERDIPEENATQLATQLPTYWGGMSNPGEGTSGPAYVGTIMFLLFAAGLFVLRSHHRWWILAAVFLTLMMSWGKYLPGFNTFLLETLPFYNKFRAPSMILVVPQLLVPLLAVITLQQVLFGERKAEEDKTLFKHFLYGVGALLGLAVLVYLFTDYGAPFDEQIRASFGAQQGGEEFSRKVINALEAARKAMFGGDIMRLAGFGLLVSGAVFLWQRKVIPAVAVVGLLLLVNSIDLIALGKNYLKEDNYVEKDEYTSANFSPTQADAAILQDKDPHFRVFNLAPNRFMEARTSYFHRSIGGYHPAKLRIYQDLIENQLSGNSLNMPVLNMLDTRYFLVPDEQGAMNVQRNDSAMGAAWFVNRVEGRNGPAEEMKALDRFNPKEVAFYDQTLQKIALQPVLDTSARVTLTKYHNELAEYTTTSASNGFVVFSEIFYPSGWTAEIDGKPTEFYKVNYLLRGLPVPAGKHTITFRFRPQSYFTAYTVATIAGVLLYALILAALFLTWRGWKKKEATALKTA